MKKIISTLVVCLLLVSCVLTLASCNKQNAVKKAFEKNEYTVTEVDSTNATVKTLLQTILTEDQMKDAEKYSILLCSKGLLNQSVVIVFPSSGDVKTFLTVEDNEGKKDTSAYDEAKEAGYINGNCYIITANSDAAEIFKKA